MDTILAPAEHARYLRELEQLRAIRDRDLPDLMREARTFVASDAAEEILQIQDDHAVVAARIDRLEALLHTARVVDDEHPPGVVALGRRVAVEYLTTGRRRSLLITGVAPETGEAAVTAASPIGRALLGRATGDVVAVALPRGRTERLRILDVQPA